MGSILAVRAPDSFNEGHLQSVRLSLTTLLIHNNNKHTGEER